MPWEFLFYMATVPLNWSEERFWEGSLRVLSAMIEKHQETEKGRARLVGFMTACFMNGKDPDEILGAQVSEPALRRKEFEMGNAMW